MRHRVRMDVRRIAVAAALSLATVGPVSYVYVADAQDQPSGQSSPQSSDSTQQGESSSSRKGSHKAAHHTTVAEEEAPAPDLTKAEDLIQKKNYAEAEPLLHRVVEQDPA